MDSPEKKSIGKSIIKGIERARSFVKNVGNTLHNMRPKTHSKTAIFNGKSENTLYPKKPFDNSYNGMKSGGGKKSGKKTKRNMRKRGTQKRR